MTRWQQGRHLRCNHPLCTATPIDADGLCILHCSETSSESAWSAVRNGGDLRLLRGATVDDPILRRLLIECRDSDGKLALRAPSFVGTLFTEATSFDDARIIGRSDWTGAVFEEIVTFRASTFTGVATFDAVTFGCPVDFSNASFMGGSFEAAHFNADVTFENAQISAELEFFAAHFMGKIDMTGVQADRIRADWTAFEEPPSPPSLMNQFRYSRVYGAGLVQDALSNPLQPDGSIKP